MLRRMLDLISKPLFHAHMAVPHKGSLKTSDYSSNFAWKMG
jgi:hypothetical protein